MLYIDEAAGHSLDTLYDKEPGTAAAIDVLLDVLEHDPLDPRVRRRCLRAEAVAGTQLTGPLWGFTVRGPDQDYLVLWELAADGADVRYIGLDVL